MPLSKQRLKHALSSHDSLRAVGRGANELADAATGRNQGPVACNGALYLLYALGCGRMINHVRCTYNLVFAITRVRPKWVFLSIRRQTIRRCTCYHYAEHHKKCIRDAHVDYYSQ
jgi:hypothetical protein